MLNCIIKFNNYLLFLFLYINFIIYFSYGWFNEPLIYRSKDPRLQFARKGNKFIKTEQIIRYLNRGLPVSKFVGIPFKS